MHAICVTSGVFQAGEGSAADLEGTVETACHICCGHREWTVSGGGQQLGSLGIAAHSLSSLHKGLPGFGPKYATNKRELSYFGDSQKPYCTVTLGQTVTRPRIGHLTTQTLFGAGGLFSWQTPLFYCLDLFSRAWTHNTRNTNEFPENCWRACRHT